LSCCERHRLACFRPTGFTRGGHQLTQHLCSGIGTYLTQLAHCRAKRSPQWWWHGETGQAPLERLNPAPLCSVGGGRLEQQILRDPNGEPEREDSAALGASTDGGQ
jgi:hypothetical protein